MEGLPLGSFDGINERLFQARTVILSGGLDAQQAASGVGQLQALAAESVRPVTLFLNAHGDDIAAGDALHDVIRFIAPPVRIVGTGSVSGAAVLVYLAAPRTDRLCLPNARFQLRQPFEQIARRPVRDVEAEAGEVRRVRDRVNQLIADATGQPPDRVAADTDRGAWMDAEEARAYGLVGRVIENVRDIG